MKKLNNKSFCMILIVLVAYVILGVVSMVLSLTAEVDTINVLTGVEYTEEELEAFKAGLRFFAIAGLIINVAIFAYFLNRIIKNRKTPQGQKYITTLFVFSIVFCVFSVFSVASDIENTTNLILALLNLVIYSVLIAACLIQKKYIPPYDETAYNNGYYGVPPQHPYGNPYGVPPQYNPYGAQDQSNPYGVPPQANPYPQYNPYATPDQSNPYANPYGAQPQNPYNAQPQNPYASGQNPYNAQPQNPYASGQNPYNAQPQNPYASGQNPYDAQPHNPYGSEQGGENPAQGSGQHSSNESGGGNEGGQN